ncbi:MULTISPECIES: recombinase family protein [unclassified Microbacterium]|uniref:recombinase family protein n=1 Tax=unclassified Microbacterium TaxID=2609290 RepID=UPI003FA5B0C8
MYLRQSLDRAEGIESQRERCSALARSRDWQIVDSFTDNETKASDVRGPGTGWGRMLPRIGKDFDVVVSVDLDRLARNTRDLNKLIDLGAAIVTVDGEIDLTSADGEFRATMIVGIARFETRRASERQKRHKAAKAERGEWHGGTPPYGFKVERGTLVPRADEAERIQEAIRRLLNLRVSMHSIIVDWNDRGIKTRKGNHWRQSNLRSILLNRSLLGETSAGVVGWDPIVDADTFDRLHALLTDPSRRIVKSPGVKGGKYTMGGGLTVCAKCGKPLITSKKYLASGDLTIISCLKRVHGPSEHHPRIERQVIQNGKKIAVTQDTGRVSIAHDILEEYVFGEVVKRLHDDNYWLSRKSETDPEADRKIAALNERRHALFEKRKRAEDLAIEGDISKERLRETVRAVEAEVEQIAKDINGLIAPPNIEDLYGRREQVLAAWPRWKVGDRRAFLCLLIDRVVVGDWPEDMARVYKPRKGETPAEYEKRHRSMMLEATRRRVAIQWVR